MGKTKYTFKGRSHGRYVWSSDEGDICCGIKYFWNPKGKVKMKLTHRHKRNAMAAALWNVRLGRRDVYAEAIDALAELEKRGYTIIKRREPTDGTAYASAQAPNYAEN